MERLTKDMERLTQQIAMYEAQTSAQAEETQAAKEALSEVTFDYTQARMHLWIETDVISNKDSKYSHIYLMFSLYPQAEMEMESLAMARAQLLQQWNGSLLGMRRRDEAFSAMQEAMR